MNWLTTADLAVDYKIWDNVEPITLEQAGRRDPLPDQSDRITVETARIGVAKRRAVTTREIIQSGGGLTSQDLVWLFPAALVPEGFEARMGSVIVTDEGERWTIQSIDLGKWRETWRCTTRNLALVFELRDRVTVERADITYDAAGAALKQFFKPLYENLPCRLQPTSKEIREERGIRGTATLFNLLLDREIDVDVAEDRIAKDGTYFEIVSYAGQQTLGEPVVLEVVKAP